MTFILRPYQIAARDFCTRRQKAFVQAPAGSGKTIIASAVVDSVAQDFDTVCWVANTREQVEQAEKAMASVLEKRPSLLFRASCAAARKDLSEADVLILDEAHHLPATTWWTEAVNAQKWVYGFSATPWTGDWERDNSLKAFFGEENFYEVPREDVMAGGSITKGAVFMHHLDTPSEFDERIKAEAEKLVHERKRRFRMVQDFELMRRAMWEVTCRYVQANEARNRKIVALAQQGEGILILVSSIEHGESLASGIDGATVVHSKMGARARREAIAAARSGHLRVMVATSLADEGLDVPRLGTLINAAGGRSAGKLEQRAGRVMRPHEGKTRGIIHDFTDLGASLAAAQAKARVKVYKKLGYSITNL